MVSTPFYSTFHARSNGVETKLELNFLSYFAKKMYLNPLNTIFRIEEFGVAVFTVSNQRHLVGVHLVTFTIVVTNTCKV